MNHIYLNSWFSPNMLFHYARYKFNYVHEHIECCHSYVKKKNNNRNIKLTLRAKANEEDPKADLMI